MRWLCAWLFIGFAGMATADCRHALAIGLDVSGSVDSREYRLQLDGLANALEAPAVRDALFAFPASPVRLTIYEWSGPTTQRIIQPWIALSDPAELELVTRTLRGWQRRGGDPSTAIGRALEVGAALLGEQSACRRQTLDLSGDGKSNTGPHPREVSRSPLMAPYTVNAITVLEEGRKDGQGAAGRNAELVAYYRAYVISGPGAFVETAAGFEDYEAAMARKLLRELEGLALSQRTPDAAVRQ